MEPFTFCVIIFACYVLLKLLKDRFRPSLPLPPGPKGYPIIGTFLHLPTTVPWRRFQEWSNIYGDVMYLKLPGDSTIILGSAQAAFDLLDKRSDIYSDRPTSVMQKMMFWDWAISLMPYTQTWREHRREFHQYFYQRKVPTYRPVQLAQCRAGLQRLLISPTENVGQNLRQIFTANILKIMYNLDITDLRDEYVVAAQKALEGVSLGSVPGKFWVEFLPILRHIPSWVPGNYAGKMAEHYKPVVEFMRSKPFDGIKQDMINGNVPPSIASSLIERTYQKSGEDYSTLIDDTLARNVAGMAYAASSDTTTSAAQSCLIAMTLYPDVQRKAQEELDRVVGPNRLPDFDDYDNLLYMRAIVLEAMRWMVVLPLCLPHRVIRDDEYKGYLIPKGTMVTPNVWAMLHDPKDYPEPEVFKPERFIKDGKINPAVRDPFTLAFGFGRRICPGRYFSNDTLFMTMASILHTFNIHPILGEDGKKFDPETELITGLISAPTHVPCTVTPRSKKAEELIRQLPSLVGEVS
ncbi:hypothetical protein QCA50_018530 [Cerrena zonata]|uniref:Cytochrome P450 n=1 Tax=Cerrena zonata TaxID=2478898 RepID=A0AAW0FHB3_9APHY